MSRCTGHCCRAFTLPFTPQGLAALVAREAHLPKSEARELAPMLVYLGTFEPQEAEARFGHCSSGEHHYWTCRNHDRVTGNCTIYETRPRMCIDYPYGKPCNYIECTSQPEPELVQIKLHRDAL